MALGGGGNAGQVGFPAYMETMHSKWLTDVDGMMGLVVDASPYNTAFSYDPTPYLDAIDQRMIDYETEVNTVIPEIDWLTFLQAAEDGLDTVLFDQDTVDDAVDAYTTAAKPEYYRALNRFAGGMSDLNAVHNSSFIIGMALMESQFQNQIDQYRANLQLQNEKVRATAILAAVEEMIKLYMARKSMYQNITSMQSDIAKIGIVARKEQYDQDLQIDVADTMFDFDVYDRGYSAMACISGAPSVSKNAPTIPSVLGGILSGASGGLQTFGQAFGKEGAFLGLLLGGGAGFLGSL